SARPRRPGRGPPLPLPRTIHHDEENHDSQGSPPHRPRPTARGPVQPGDRERRSAVHGRVRPQDPATGEVADSVAEQTRQVLRNLQAVLAERGATLDDALKATVHLADLAAAPALNQPHREFSTEPFPVRPPVGAELANLRVESDLVVRIPG